MDNALMLVGFMCAVVAMLLYGASSVSQAFAAGHASDSAVLRHPAYLAGLVADGAAWLLQLVALKWLPVFVVQSILAASVGATVLLAIPFLKVHPIRRESVAILVTLVGLVLVSAAAGPESVGTIPDQFGSVMVVAPILTALLSVLYYRSDIPFMHAVLAGLGFSYAVLAARALEIEGTVSWSLLANKSLWALLLGGIIGLVMYARALEKGSVGPVTAILWVVEVIVPSVVGVTVLGDTVRAGWGIPALLGALLALGSCIVLAQSPAQK